MDDFSDDDLFDRQVESDEDENENEYEVGVIKDDKWNSKKKQHEYLVGWKGWTQEHDTWEPEENLTNCKALLEEYKKQKKLRQSKPIDEAHFLVKDEHNAVRKQETSFSKRSKTPIDMKQKRHSIPHKKRPKIDLKKEQSSEDTNSSDGEEAQKSRSARRKTNKNEVVRKKAALQKLKEKRACKGLPIKEEIKEEKPDIKQRPIRAVPSDDEHIGMEQDGFESHELMPQSVEFGTHVIEEQDEADNFDKGEIGDQQAQQIDRNTGTEDTTAAQAQPLIQPISAFLNEVPEEQTEETEQMNDVQQSLINEHNVCDPVAFENCTADKELEEGELEFDDYVSDDNNENEISMPHVEEMIRQHVKVHSSTFVEALIGTNQQEASGAGEVETQEMDVEEQLYQEEGEIGNEVEAQEEQSIGQQTAENSPATVAEEQKMDAEEQLCQEEGKIGNEVEAEEEQTVKQQTAESPPPAKRSRRAPSEATSVGSQRLRTKEKFQSHEKKEKPIKKKKSTAMEASSTTKSKPSAEERVEAAIAWALKPTSANWEDWKVWLDMDVTEEQLAKVPLEKMDPPDYKPIQPIDPNFEGPVRELGLDVCSLDDDQPNGFDRSWHVESIIGQADEEMLFVKFVGYSTIQKLPAKLVMNKAFEEYAEWFDWVGVKGADPDTRGTYWDEKLSRPNSWMSERALAAHRVWCQTKKEEKNA